MRFLRSTAVVIALGLSAPAAALAADPPAPDAPQAQAQAESLAARAFEAYSKGDFSAALSLYTQALQYTSAAAIYFNIASLYDKKLPDRELAIEFYRKTISAPDATSDLTLKATARMQALKQGDKPAEPAPASTEPTAAAQPSSPLAAQPEEDPAAQPEEDPGSVFRIAGIAVGGLGLVALGVGLGFGADAKSKLDSAQESCTGPNCTTQQGIDDMNAASDSATLSTALCLVGGGAIGVGVALYVLAPKRPRKGAAATGSVRLAPVVGPSGAGINLSGSFF